MRSIQNEMWYKECEKREKKGNRERKDEGEEDLFTLAVLISSSEQKFLLLLFHEKYHQYKYLLLHISDFSKDDYSTLST